MTRPIAVLRPEPGNAATVARIEALGHIAIRLPLFEVRPLAWEAPDPAEHDVLILTSANALRHGGEGLAKLRTLPVHAVGQATAAAARTAGFHVARTGTHDAEALLDQSGATRALHLTGRDRAIPERPPITRTIPVYASEALDVDLPPLAGAVALLHSARAAHRLAKLVPNRTAIRLAALSPAVLAAAGTGWAAMIAAAQPTDEALLFAVLSLVD